MLAPNAPALLKTTGILLFFAAALRDGIEDTGHWGKASLRDWGGPGDHWPLTHLTGAGEYVFAQRGVTSFAAMTDPEVLGLARALEDTAADIAQQVARVAPLVDTIALLAHALAAQSALTTPNGCISDQRTGRFALALGDADTEYSGVYSTVRLEDLLQSVAAADTGVRVCLDDNPTILDVIWEGAPLTEQVLSRYEWVVAAPPTASSPTPTPTL